MLYPRPEYLFFLLPFGYHYAWTIRIAGISGFVYTICNCENRVNGGHPNHPEKQSFWPWNNNFWTPFMDSSANLFVYSNENPIITWLSCGRSHRKVCATSASCANPNRPWEWEKIQTQAKNAKELCRTGWFTESTCHILGVNQFIYAIFVGIHFFWIHIVGAEDDPWHWNH